MDESVLAPLPVPAPTVTDPEKILSPAVTSGATPSSCRATVPAFTDEAFRDTASPVLGGPEPGATEHVATKLSPADPPMGLTPRLHEGEPLLVQSNRSMVPAEMPPALHSNCVGVIELPLCTPTVAPAPVSGTAPKMMSNRAPPSYNRTSKPS